MATKKYTDEDLIMAFQNATSLADIVRKLGLSVGGRAIKSVKYQCTKLGLDWKGKVGRKSNSKYSDEDIIQYFYNSTSLADLCRKLGLSQSGNSLLFLRRKCEALNLDWQSKKAQNWAKGKTFVHDERRFKYTDEQIFCKESPYLGGSTALKKRAKELGYLKDYCEICGQANMWNGKELCLIIDHIDGNNRNNDPSNLRSVCPNCDIQLPTSRGKNKRKSS